MNQFSMKVLAGIQHSSLCLLRHHYCMFAFLKITLKHFLYYKLLKKFTILLFYDEVSGLSLCG